MTDINLCSPTHEEQSAEINLCSSEQEEQDREISLCPGDCPEVLPELLLSGPEDAAVGTEYTASGGVAPYSFSISCGTIDSSGTITDLTGCCGSGTITVYDSCGQSKSVAVRFPTGQWVLTGWETSGTIASDDGVCNTYPQDEPACSETSDLTGSDCSDYPEEFVSVNSTCKRPYRTYTSSGCPVDPVFGQTYRIVSYYCRPLHAWVCP